MFAAVRRLLWIVPCLIAADACAGDPSALWKITNDKCVPHMRQSNDPAPCSIVDLNAGYVILKDLIGATQFLLIPTERMSGIDSPEILAPNAPNYWDLAWRARTETESRAGKALPRDMLSLAINSPAARSQDQLHIHIDCVSPDVRAALAAHRDAITAAWTAFPVVMSGQRWSALRVDGENLGAINPFRLLANDSTDSAAMAKHSLAVIGINWAGNAPGFVVLDTTIDLATGSRGSAEDLQDHDCALAR